VLALTHAQMSVRRVYKQSDLEKRMASLSQQLYGKKSSVSVDQPVSKLANTDISTHRYTDIPTHAESSRNSDITFLKQDLTKIFIFSALAFAVEVGIYFSHIYTKIKLF